MRKMGITAKESFFFYVCFLSLFIAVAASVETRWEEQLALVAYQNDLGLANQELADCLHEWLHSVKFEQDTGQELRLGKLTYGDRLSSIRFFRTNLYGTIDDLHRLVDQLLLYCTRKKDTMPSDGREDMCSGRWINRHFRFLFNGHCLFTRRILVQMSGEAPAPSPLLMPTPATSPPPSPIPAGTQNLPTDLDNSSHGRKTSKITVVVAVVVSATLTLVCAVALFLACLKYSGFSFGRRSNDERPLLSLTPASSTTLFASGSHFDEEKLDDQSFRNKLNPDKVGEHSILDPSFARQRNKLNRSKVGENFYSDQHPITNSRIDFSGSSMIPAATYSADDSSHLPPRIWDTPVFAPLKLPPARAAANPCKPPSGSEVSPAHTPPVSSSVIGQYPSLPGGQPRPLPAADVITLGPQPSKSAQQVSVSLATRPPVSPVATPPPPPGAPPPPPRLPHGTAVPPPPPPHPRPVSVLPQPSPPPLPSAAATQLHKAAQSTSSSQWHSATAISTVEGETAAAKTKLKPFFWDKVMANPDHSMVWHQIKSGSFQFDEDMIESLFGYPASEKNKNEKKKNSSSQDAFPYVRIIDHKKAQNLSILLKALGVTKEEVCDALNEGNELPSELILTLLKMAPTPEEELKLRLYSGEVSQLDTAERFLKVLVDIPFAFARLESLLFMCTLQEEVSMLKESFAVLEAACTQLRQSRLFLKLLEAVLKTGNRMNDGTFRGGAHAFKLDTLLKLSDVKGTDGKTTLLHFVVEEIIRSEGVRAARAAKESSSTSSDFLKDSDETLRRIGLQAVSSLSDELRDVKNAAVLDLDSLKGTVVKLGDQLVKARSFLNSDMKKVPEKNGFHRLLRSFVQNAESDVMWALEEESRVMLMVRSTAAYFHGNSGKDEGLRLFVIVRDFLILLDKVCKQVAYEPQKPSLPSQKEHKAAAAPPAQRQKASPNLPHHIVSAITDRRRAEDLSSEDES